MAFFVYIMTNKPNGTLYVGYTDDLGRRVHEHRNKVQAGFTAKYGLARLVYYEAFESREQAKRREARMKHWLRAWKVAAIEGMNPAWRDLGDEVPLP